MSRFTKEQICKIEEVLSYGYPYSVAKLKITKEFNLESMAEELLYFRKNIINGKYLPLLPYYNLIPEEIDMSLFI